jgi:hypothetical protein
VQPELQSSVDPKELLTALPRTILWDVDHLPNVKDPYEPIDIPYLGGEEYDGRDFDGYPARQNRQINLLVEGDLQGQTAVEAGQFLQTWLYFGMLDGALRLAEDDCIELKDFIRIDTKTQQRFITTHQLPELLRSLYKRVKQTHDVSAYYERFRGCMNLLYEVWRDLMKSSSNDSILQLPSQEILLSIQILNTALDTGIAEICGSRTDYIWSFAPPPKWLMQRMIRQGWCPTIVEQLSRPRTTFLYYCSLLGPPRRDDDHRKCSVDGRHVLRRI